MCSLPEKADPIVCQSDERKRRKAGHPPVLDDEIYQGKGMAGIHCNSSTDSKFNSILMRYLS